MHIRPAHLHLLRCGNRKALICSRPSQQGQCLTPCKADFHPSFTALGSRNKPYNQVRRHHPFTSGSRHPVKLPGVIELRKRWGCRINELNSRFTSRPGLVGSIRSSHRICINRSNCLLAPYFFILGPNKLNLSNLALQHSSIPSLFQDTQMLNSIKSVSIRAQLPDCDVVRWQWGKVDCLVVEMPQLLRNGTWKINKMFPCLNIAIT